MKSLFMLLVLGSKAFAPAPETRPRLRPVHLVVPDWAAVGGSAFAGAAAFYAFIETRYVANKSLEASQALQTLELTKARLELFNQIDPGLQHNIGTLKCC